ncbi:nitrite reductase large subunit NirB [Zooshikella harenae]|uniref:Nitrite reductase large subunit NirB n=1 Tax=Zooshikella harenae TaxID=2827238 RepID=A0ABS5ZJ35_9GAMM|nr:nitrite reductase large subunit NirB [Zooshikella harenae]MBU2713007.1 nitrite reductase large subunit NirB [Zooshikella harenae]
MKLQKIVIIGNGMVGHEFIRQMLIQPSVSQFTMTTISSEPRLAYDRVQLSSFFSGTPVKKLMLTDENYYKENNVNFILNEKVIAIDKDKKRVYTTSGLCEVYDKLILATGSYPFVPPIAGNDQPHCLVYRTIEDLERIKVSAEFSKIGVVVGGGLLGLEAANALKNLGLETHVVEFAPQLMAIQLDESGSALLKRKIEALGVSIHIDKSTKDISTGTNARYRMMFTDGSHLETDMIVFSAGIRPYDELARSCALEIGERGGIAINNVCQTSDPNIYAIGECALWNKKIFGLVAPGYQMARVAVSHITGGNEQFSGADMSTKLKLLGVQVGSIGDAHGHTTGAQCYSFCDETEQVYKRLVVSGSGKKLLGAILVGDTEDYSNLLQLYLNGIDLPQSPEQLLIPSHDLNSAPVLGVDALPESAQLCTCYSVSKGDIQQAVLQGCCDMAAIKSSTSASTGCGGCSALVKQVMDSELTKQGITVNNHLCEHFSYTRQALVDIIRIQKIKTFDSLLEKYGKGLGCDICKPTVASILSSYWNEYILKKEHVGLQDTNDAFLANLQKNGSYSVVPRIPGGEITPDKLIAIGNVAKQFNLYTKITGGQRIDLFGAALHQLPEIWKQLIDAGFETGHAYGKAMRTVKSCVGTNWCRYGVQDSTSMAIAIEDRYKGLRSPHKIKMAVSGCTRECAEAQSKDIGVIATEKGWNLYVGGNGGMRPRHATLFASDLDNQTLICYIDRILMFYIRTADRLQRTSVWLENMEGGIDYLRSVVVEDKLGICDVLEQEMVDCIANYQCEWRTTLENPERLKRFRHFINSDQPDSNLIYSTERDQIKPMAIEH